MNNQAAAIAPTQNYQTKMNAPSVGTIAPSTQATQAASNLTHQVQQGETLYSIAHQHTGNGANWVQLHQANQDVLGNSTALTPGQSLKLPQSWVNSNAINTATKYNNEAYKSALLANQNASTAVNGGQTRSFANATPTTTTTPTSTYTAPTTTNSFKPTNTATTSSMITAPTLSNSTVNTSIPYTPVALNSNMKSANIPTVADTSVAATPGGNTSSLNYNQVFNGVANANNPSEQQAVNADTSAINSIAPIYNAATTEGNTNINNLNAATNTTIGNMNTQQGNVNQAMLNSANATENIMASQENASLGNIAASAAARGLGGGDPFVVAEQVAAQQPYNQQYAQINAATQASLAKSVQATLSTEATLEGVTQTAISGIVKQLLANAPLEASQLITAQDNLASVWYKYSQLNSATAQQVTAANQSYQAALTTAADNLQGSLAQAHATVKAANIAAHQQGADTTANNAAALNRQNVGGVHYSTGYYNAGTAKNPKMVYGTVGTDNAGNVVSGVPGVQSPTNTLQNTINNIGQGAASQFGINTNPSGGSSQGSGYNPNGPITIKKVYTQ